jgi:hypothetical protein
LMVVPPQSWVTTQMVGVLVPDDGSLKTRQPVPIGIRPRLGEQGHGSAIVCDALTPACYNPVNIIGAPMPRGGAVARPGMQAPGIPGYQTAPQSQSQFPFPGQTQGYQAPTPFTPMPGNGGSLLNRPGGSVQIAPR